MKVSIIGSGTVGYAVGTGLAQFGHDVLFCDVDEERVRELSEKGLNSRIEAKVREITFVTVPAPTKENGELDLSYLKDTLTDIGLQIRGKESYPIVVVKSTVLPQLIREQLLPLLQETSQTTVGGGFGFCYNPEFLREKHALEDFMNPDRIVLGECDKRATEKLEGLYAPFDAPLYKIGLKEAAMVKYVANNFLSTKISYFNEVYLIAKEWDIDPDVVAEIVSEDRRISDYGITGGREFGGKCLPKDLDAFLHFSKKKNNPSLLKAVKKVNEKMKESELRRKIEGD